MKYSARSRETENLSESVRQRLNMYALAASAAGVGVLALASPAEAKIVYTQAHVQLQLGQPFSLDLNRDGKVDFYLVQRRLFLGRTNSASSLSVCHAPLQSSFANCFVSQSSNAPNALNAVRVAMQSTTFSERPAAALRAGANIQRGDRFMNKKPVAMGKAHFFHPTNGPSSTYWRDPWVNGGKGVKNRYLGLKFKISGKFHFGWARMTVITGKGGFTSTLTGYAYESIPGKSIVAGQTKGRDGTTDHGASLGHLAAGASVVPAWRERQSATTSR